MLIIPALDLWKGKVVRFFKGDPALSTVYSENPLEVAGEWKKQGAELLHLVDLSAALGQEDNFEIVKRILKEVDIKVEIGGGIRDESKAEKLVSLGAERIIIGTKGLDGDFLRRLIKSLGRERISVSVDVINSQVAVKGWQEETYWNALGFVEHLRDEGVKWIIYTDISRDGTLEGANLEQIKEFSSFTKVNIIASGGVSSLDELRKIKQEASFVWGVIVGKALYEEKFQLSEALNIL